MMNTPRDAAHAAPVHLLWTGGWDSTFRLLQLLLRQRVPVVPHYLEDPTRVSTRSERVAMARITERLHEQHPQTRALLQRLRIVSVRDVEVPADIAEALARVRDRHFIGSQYAWLPAYARANGLDGLELGIHVDDKVQALLRGMTEHVEHDNGVPTVRMHPRHAALPEYALFGAFRFPLFDVDKRGIDRAAVAEGWRPLMEMTWFCHSPVRGKPCGLCPPCVYTIEEGLGRRVPASRRALSFAWRHLAWPLRDPLRRARDARRAAADADAR